MIEMSLMRVNETIANASDAGMNCSSSFFSKAAEAHFALQALGGFDGLINQTYFHWSQNVNLPQSLRHELSEYRFDALIVACLVREDFGQICGWLLPSASGAANNLFSQSNATLPFPFLPPASGKKDVPTEEDTSLLSGLFSSAIVCDIVAGNTGCVDELSESYRDSLADNWSQTAVATILKDMVPARDSIEELLLGRQYIDFVLELLEDTDCVISWLEQYVFKQGRSPGEAFCTSISLLYNGKLFRQPQSYDERIDQVRVSCITRITNKIFGEAIDYARELKKAMKAEGADVKQGVISEWSYASGFVYVQLEKALTSSSDLGDSAKASILESCRKVLMDQPMVRGIGRIEVDRAFRTGCSAKRNGMKASPPRSPPKIPSGEADVNSLIGIGGMATDFGENSLEELISATGGDGPFINDDDTLGSGEEELGPFGSMEVEEFVTKLESLAESGKVDKEEIKRFREQMDIEDLTNNADPEEAKEHFGDDGENLLETMLKIIDEETKD